MKSILFKVPLFIILFLPPAMAETNELEVEIEKGDELPTGNWEQDYSLKISHLEREFGAYHVTLIAPLNDLAMAYQKSGAVLKAIEMYERALHINKVNLGVHNLSQADLIERLIENYSSLQDWQQVAAKMHYLLWVYRRNFDSSDDRLVAMMERVGRWYRQAYWQHQGGEALSFLVEADDLVDEALAIVELQAGPDANQLVSLLHLSSIINAQIASDVKNVFRQSHRDIREAMIPNNRGTPYANEIAVREYYFEQSFYKGRRALNRVIKIFEKNLPETTVDYAQILVYQGDYYLALNRKWNAMKNYRKAFAVLMDNNASEEEIRFIFGEPRRVKPFTLPGQELSTLTDKSYIDALVDIPANGWPRNIRILASQPNNGGERAKRGKHSVAATRYRPRFENAEPVPTENVSLRYVFRK
ncbi:MAG: hypothetical protein GKR93_10410 [Gammaproteobacteria bacterium]|nr:hypothetical protein [Gammaproteobacteria bacterium]